MKSFLWVRSAFRRLLADAPPHVVKVESWHMALAWLEADSETQAQVVAQLTTDCDLDTAST